MTIKTLEFNYLKLHLISIKIENKNRIILKIATKIRLKSNRNANILSKTKLNRNDLSRIKIQCHSDNITKNNKI